MGKFHGLHTSATYRAWSSLRQRCSNPKNGGYARYGGRGITYDPRWSDFRVFLQEMGERPETPPGLTLDRIDNNLGYFKDNCRWVSRKAQAQNTRRCKYILFQGVRKTESEWAESIGISHQGLSGRLKRMSVERALTPGILPDRQRSKTSTLKENHH